MYLILKISRPSSSIIISFNSRIFLTAGEIKLNPKLVFSCFKMYYDAYKESLVWKERDFSHRNQHRMCESPCQQYDTMIPKTLLPLVSRNHRDCLPLSPLWKYSWENRVAKVWISQIDISVTGLDILPYMNTKAWLSRRRKWNAEILNFYSSFILLIGKKETRLFDVSICRNDPILKCDQLTWRDPREPRYDIHQS